MQKYIERVYRYHLGNEILPSSSIWLYLVSWSRYTGMWATQGSRHET